MLRTAIVFAGILALAWSQSTPVSSCQNHGGSLPINTYIENCGSPPCRLPQLQDAVVHMTFRAPYTINSMTTLATAYLPYVPIGIPYPLGDQANACNSLTNTGCPVYEGQNVDYTLRMYIEPAFPVGTSVDVEFRIVDDNNNPVVCLRVPLLIIDPAGRSDGEAKKLPASATLPLLVQLNAL